MAVDVKKFSADGFLAFDRIADDATVTEIGLRYDQMLAGEIDCSPTDRKLGRFTRQIMTPSRYHPVFRDNAAREAGRAIAKELLATPDPVFVFDMLINKEPGHTATTPWHQDLAYAAMPFVRPGVPITQATFVQFWLALDDVDVENGCMQFVPGQHRKPLLEHYVAGGEPTDEGRMLAIRAPESALNLASAVACPLRAGGATVHGHGTPHFTSGNRTSNRRRRAYIFNFANPALLKHG
jgi:ectoine hydroxylase-related dioxygenase (phytanoyl-CoA dioxygenase family)